MADYESMIDERIGHVLFERAISRFVAALELILSGTGDEECAIFTGVSPNLYVQFSADPGEERLYGEAVSNAYLEPGERLSAAQTSRLLSAGWQEPGGEAVNFHREWTVLDQYDIEIVALEAARALTEMNGPGALDAVTIKLV